MLSHWFYYLLYLYIMFIHNFFKISPELWFFYRNDRNRLPLLLLLLLLIYLLLGFYVNSLSIFIDFLLHILLPFLFRHFSNRIGFSLFTILINNLWLIYNLFPNDWFLIIYLLIIILNLLI